MRVLISHFSVIFEFFKDLWSTFYVQPNQICRHKGANPSEFLAQTTMLTPFSKSISQISEPNGSCNSLP
jgi:hypothetical protein